jgi:hypothetical protein
MGGRSLSFNVCCYWECIILYLFCIALTCTSSAADQDPNDNKGNTPFFLQDPSDQMCLGPNGFTLCDERALWILTKRDGVKQGRYSLVSLLNDAAPGPCLQRKTSFLGLWPSKHVGMGSCKSKSAKSWEFEFTDQSFVRLSLDGQCMIRGTPFKSSFSLQPCSKNEYVPLIYHPTAVHENGFYLKAADGKCFDGGKFRSCEGKGSTRLLWGIGVKFVGGHARRYFFGFNVNDRGNCLIHSGQKVEKGPCSSRNTVSWGITNGIMTLNGKCLARRADDSAVLVDCSQASEYISFEVPSIYSNEQLTSIVQKKEVSGLLILVSKLLFDIITDIILLFVSSYLLKAVHPQTIENIFLNKYFIKL